MVNRAGSLIGSGGPKILEAYSDSRTLTSSDQTRLGGTIIITAFLVSLAAPIKSRRALVHLQTGNGGAQDCWSRCFQNGVIVCGAGMPVRAAEKKSLSGAEGPARCGCLARVAERRNNQVRPERFTG
jgi:hypothetical protein